MAEREVRANTITDTKRKAIRFTNKQMHLCDVILFQYADRYDFLARSSDCSSKVISIFQPSAMSPHFLLFEHQLCQVVASIGGNIMMATTAENFK